MRARSCLSILLSMAAGLGAVHGSQQWTSSDGKTITASFVRLGAAGNSVVIQQEAKIYEVEFSRLSPESQQQAVSLQEKKTAWAAQEALKPLLTESVLVELLRFDRSPLVGKHYFVSGRVEKILPPASVSSAQPRLELALGTVSLADFSSYGVPGTSKLKFSPDRVSLVFPSKDQGETELLRAGQAVTIQLRVDQRQVAGLGLADPVEVREARNSPASRSFETYLSEEVRVQALPPLAAGPVTAAPPASAAANPAGPETPPSGATANPLLQWLLSLLGQSGAKAGEAP